MSYTGTLTRLFAAKLKTDQQIQSNRPNESNESSVYILVCFTGSACGRFYTGFIIKRLNIYYV